MTDRPTLTDDEIRRRIECAPLLGEPAATEVRALAAEVLSLRARVAELEAGPAARLTPAQIARMEAAGWTPGEAAVSEWLVGRAERCAALDVPDAD